jgi:hypothetical protein
MFPVPCIPAVGEPTKVAEYVLLEGHVIDILAPSLASVGRVFLAAVVSIEIRRARPTGTQDD